MYVRATREPATRRGMRLTEVVAPGHDRYKREMLRVLPPHVVLPLPLRRNALVYDFAVLLTIYVSLCAARWGKGRGGREGADLGGPCTSDAGGTGGAVDAPRPPMLPIDTPRPRGRAGPWGGGVAAVLPAEAAGGLPRPVEAGRVADGGSGGLVAAEAEALRGTAAPERMALREPCGAAPKEVSEAGEGAVSGVKVVGGAGELLGEGEPNSETVAVAGEMTPSIAVRRRDVIASRLCGCVTNDETRGGSFSIRLSMCPSSVARVARDRL